MKSKLVISFRPIAVDNQSWLIVVKTDGLMVSDHNFGIANKAFGAQKMVRMCDVWLLFSVSTRDVVWMDGFKQ